MNVSVDRNRDPAAYPPVITAEAEQPARELKGAPRWIASILTAGLSLYALAWVVVVIEPQIYRVSFLLIALVAVFLIYPLRRGGPSGLRAFDWILIGIAIGALAWPLLDFERFIYRAAEPTVIDLACGALALLIVLEATRRAVGWTLPLTAGAFLLYAYFGPVMDAIGLGLLAHRGYGADRIIGSLYMTLEGVFGVPLDVAATYIALFAIYGAILEFSGAGDFFLRWTLAVLGRSGRGSGPARTVAAAGFLLGTVSGSGVATTVTLGSVAWPLLRRAGYPADVSGAMLSAAGIGAILSPPTLGAAAFLIAEFLQISYLQVVLMALGPTILYYVSIFLMIEAESRRSGAVAVSVGGSSLRRLTLRYGYHFTSLAAIVVFMAFGMTAFRAVFWSSLLAAALSFLTPETALRPRKLMRALETSGAGVCAVVATTATAGIIVGVVTLTGLGLKISGVIVSLAGGSLPLTAIYAAAAVLLLGLAVPVTASYIIAAVMIAPALIEAGAPAVAAHMFIFYYAVLSEVSPPTALSPVAAAALTGANPSRTMMLTWKYTLPAFLVPFVFTLSPEGMGVLLQAPLQDILRTTLTAVFGVAALAAGAGGWIRRRATGLERLLAVASGLMLMYPSIVADVAGILCLAAVLALHFGRSKVGEHAAE